MGRELSMEFDNKFKQNITKFRLFYPESRKAERRDRGQHIQKDGSVV